ncbi:MAG: hypothetical protein WDW38_008408 [Sanguina aurantia]
MSAEVENPPMTQAFAEVDQGTDMYLKPVVVSPVELIPLAGAAPAVEESPVLLVTTVDIGGGRSERIEIRHGDDPSDAARHFCDRHRLPPSIVGPLTEHILDNIRKATTPAESPAPPIASDSPPVSSSHEQQQQQLLPSRNSPPLPQILPTAAPAITGDRNRAKLASDHKGPSQDGTFPGAGGPGGPFSFNGPLDERLLEQLSSKLVPMDGGSMGDGRLSNVLNAATELLRSGGSSKRNSVSSEQRQHTLKSRSAEPSPRDSVHLRLYVGAQDRQQRLEQRRKMQAAEVTASQGLNRSSMSWISTEMMRERTAGVFDNYGEMLYAEGLEASAVLKKKGENERAERDAAELAGATFHPEITALAKALYDGSGFEGSAAWQRLSKGMRGKTLERIAQLRTQQEVAEISECTFKPVLNRASVAMMAERSETLRSLNITHHEQLFQDAMRRQSKMDELANWYPDEVTFQPAVNKSQAAKEYLRRSWDKMGTSGAAGLLQHTQLMQPSVTSSVAASEQGANVDVVDRLYASYEKRNARLEEARAKQTGPVDPATGRTLYQPEMGRGPRSFSRNHEGVPIGEYLHTAAQELASRRQATADAELRTADEAANGGRACGNSHKLFQRLKLKRFQQIFEYLDEEACGSLDLVALVALPPSNPLDTLPPSPDTTHPPHAQPPRSQRVENLDNEVLADVELAAALWAKEHGSLPLAPSDSLSAAGSSDGVKGSRPPPLGLDHFIEPLPITPTFSGPSWLQPPWGDPSQGSQQSNQSTRVGAMDAALQTHITLLSDATRFQLSPPTPFRTPTPSSHQYLTLGLNAPCTTGAMEAALAQRRGPRSYLVPSPSSKKTISHTYKPAINARSKEMAAKLRPPEVALHEILHQNARHTKDKLEAKRQETQEALLRDCTFQPKLNGVRGSGIFVTAASRAEAQATAAATASNNNRTSRTLNFHDNGSDTVASDSPSRSADSPRQQQHAHHPGSPSPYNARSTLDSSALNEFAALERELTDMLEATGSATQRLDHLKQHNKASAASGDGGFAGGSNPSEPRDLKVIEEMLLHQLHDPSKGGIDYDAGLTKMVARLSSQGLEGEGLRGPAARSGGGVVAGGGSAMQHLAEELAGPGW